MAAQRLRVTLLTDFGLADGYVGEIKAVFASDAPEADIIDIAHDVAPQDVESARLAVARYWRRFPEGTVHLVVVDPGVGTDRAAIAVTSAGRWLVGPDNGVLSPALLAPDATVVSLTVPHQVSSTFHGRDVFAPAAVALLRGAVLSDLGSSHPDPVIRRTPEPRRGSNGLIHGEIITIDRFGNAVTNCLGVYAGTVVVAGEIVPLVRTYGDAAPGSVVALVGSSGLIEIAERNGNAARRLGLVRGTEVRIQRRG